MVTIAIFVRQVIGLVLVSVIICVGFVFISLVMAVVKPFVMVMSRRWRFSFLSISTTLPEFWIRTIVYIMRLSGFICMRLS
jgi:H+/gluconate symporter-like permease